MSLVLLTITLDSVFSGLIKGIFNFRIYRRTSTERYILYLFVYIILLILDIFLWFLFTTRFLVVLCCVPVVNRKLLSISSVDRCVEKIRETSLEVYRFLLFQASLYIFNIYMNHKGEAPIYSLNVPSVEELGDMTNFIISLILFLLISTLPDNGTWKRRQELRIVNFIARYYITSSMTPILISPTHIKHLLRESRWKELSDPEVLKHLSMDLFVRELFVYSRGKLKQKAEIVSLLSALMSLPYGFFICVLFLHRRFLTSIFPIMRDNQSYILILSKCLSLYIVSGYSWIEIIFTLILTEIFDESIISFIIFIVEGTTDKIRSLIYNFNEKIVEISTVTSIHVPIALGISGNYLSSTLLILPSTLKFWYSWPIIILFGYISSYTPLHLFLMSIALWGYALTTHEKELVDIREEHF